MDVWTKIILTSKKEIKEKLVSNLNLKLKEENSQVHVYNWYKEETEIALIYYNIWDEKLISSYIKENFIEVIKIINVWEANILSDVDLKFGDIILPNAFINEENEWIFIDYATWKNYDLNKFWLILNGICLSLNKKENEKINLTDIIEKYSPDIIDYESFYILKELKNKDFWDKIVWIKLVVSDNEDENKNNLENLINITELSL